MWLKIGRQKWRLRGAGQVFVLMAVLSVLAAWNTGMNLLYLLFGGLMSFVMMSVFFSARNLKKLEVSREAPAAVHKGSEFGVIVNVRNRRAVVPAISVRMESGAKPGVSEGYVVKLPAGRIATARMSEVFERRGVHKIPDLQLVTTFPFGLIETRARVSDGKEVVVYPKVSALRATAIERTQVSGTITKVAKGVGDEFFSLREYIPGDDLRHMAWRASARTGRLMVKELSRETSRFVVFVMDTRRRPDMFEFDTLFEDSVDLVASLAVTLLSRQYSIALITGDSYLPEGEGKSHTLDLLGMLARLQPTDDGVDAFSRIGLVDGSKRAVYVYLSPDPVQWGRRIGPFTVLDPRSVVHA